MKRSVLERRTPLKRTRGKSRPTIPVEVREEVKADRRYRGRPA